MANKAVMIKDEYGCWDCSGTRYEPNRGLIIPLKVDDFITYSLIPNRVIREMLECNRKKTLFERIKSKFKKN